VTQFPELHDALVEAAGRYHAPRRRTWRIVRLAVPAVAVAAAVLAILLALPRSPDTEQAAPPAKPVVRLEQRFEVFRRPRTAADRLPGDTLAPRLHPKQARLVAQLGIYKVFLVPAGSNSVCAVEFSGELEQGSECGPVASAVDNRTLMARFGPDYVWYAFPDGVHDVQLTRSDGTLVRPEVRDNGIIVKVSEAPYSVTWVAADGELHGNLLDRIEIGRPQCAELQRLPAGAEDRVNTTAALAARVFYPQISDAEAVSVRPADVAGCGERAAGRVLLVELRLDREPGVTGQSRGQVLIGQVNGRPAVWLP
jgi:hypothetical protein